MVVTTESKFKFMITVSAILISSIAAIFSVTGISSLFKGSFLTVLVMASALEIGKVVVASYLARYWKSMPKLIRAYLMIAVTILMIITSAGIFGYLSDAYQKTKGNYEIVDQEVTILKNKKIGFEKQIDRNDVRISRLEKLNDSYTTRIDSLNSRNLSTYNTDRAIFANNKEIRELRNEIKVGQDSVDAVDVAMISKENTNISGELGPLRYIAKVFNTDMDTVVKWFILALIFVFDPLAILLFVSLNTMNIAEIIKKSSKDVDVTEKVLDIDKKSVIFNKLDTLNSDIDIKAGVVENKGELISPNIMPTINLENDVPISNTDILSQQINTLQTTEQISEQIPVVAMQPNVTLTESIVLNTATESIINNNAEESATNDVVTPIIEQSSPVWKTANYRGNVNSKSQNDIKLY